ncbi:collagen alpha-1(I) chain-like [Corvus moneduloides]|uniref:collagen alpha-1(I) chain-like n=1 Tax=Corvus moneduloides TaxID=1196302 RepID=UPI0013625618|nr:collagen alpha-1(I) chain-like [Corvus moneduloides]
MPVGEGPGLAPSTLRTPRPPLLAPLAAAVPPARRHAVGTARQSTARHGTSAPRSPASCLPGCHWQSPHHARAPRGPRPRRASAQPRGGHGTAGHVRPGSTGDTAAAPGDTAAAPGTSGDPPRPEAPRGAGVPLPGVSAVPPAPPAAPGPPRQRGPSGSPGGRLSPPGRPVRRRPSPPRPPNKAGEPPRPGRLPLPTPRGPAGGDVRDRGGGPGPAPRALTRLRSPAAAVRDGMGRGARHRALALGRRDRPSRHPPAGARLGGGDGPSPGVPAGKDRPPAPVPGCVPGGADPVAGRAGAPAQFAVPLPHGRTGESRSPRRQRRSEVGYLRRLGETRGSHRHENGKPTRNPAFFLYLGTSAVPRRSREPAGT